MLERVWGNSDASTNGSTAQLASSANMAGEEQRESEDCSQRRCRMAMSCASE